jgi:DNA-binding transcriptional LysR family regulator|tara:strand:+ start:1029 stop:1946 length:918 start_codon:yes stop_codon:yes gene_type:complete
MEVDPRLLLYLKVINDHGTLTSAARAIGISQPALTNKIKLLERQLGTDLVDSGRHGTKLNHFGKLLLRHAKMIGASLNSAVEELLLAKSGKHGPLVIGATPMSTVELVPKALNLLDIPEKQAQISLIEADDDILLDMLKSGEIDLMLGGMATGRNQMNIQEEYLAEFPLMAVVGQANPIWSYDQIALKDIVDHAWAIPSAGSVIRSYVDAIFVGAQQEMPTSYWTCTSMHSLKTIVRHTKRITVMPRHAFTLEEDLGVLKGIRLIGPTSSRRMKILRLKHALLSPIAQDFIKNLHAISRSLSNKA